MQLFYSRTFLYKIYSGYDGFDPSRLPSRIKRKHLSLGWRQYIEVVECGDQVWVYFYGKATFEPGVYLKGTVRHIDVKRRRITLRVGQMSITKPLSSKKTSARIARAISAHGRQVFLVRSMETNNPLCTPQRCASHRCGTCPVWKRMPVIRPSDYAPPWMAYKRRLRVVPAYWVVPSRCYLSARKLNPRVLLSSEVFYEFKSGQGDLGYPLARGIVKALKRRNVKKFDCVVAIPLSPDKERHGELNRTRVLAEEVARILKAPRRRLLSLSSAISKRRWQSRGHSITKFRRAYRSRLKVRGSSRNYHRILLVDDVCTHGNTLALAADALKEINPEAEIVAAAAGQMITKDTVKNNDGIRRRRRR